MGNILKNLHLKATRGAGIAHPINEFILRIACCDEIVMRNSLYEYNLKTKDSSVKIVN
jgi:hypothetical protein